MVEFKTGADGILCAAWHGMAYLNQLIPVLDLPGHRHLRSPSTLKLFVLSYHLTSIGCQSVPVAAAVICRLSSMAKDIPKDMFQQSFLTSSSLWHYWLCFCGLWNGYCCSSHDKNVWLIDCLIDWLYCANVYAVHVDDQLAVTIAKQIRNWTSYPDIQLHMHAVKIVSNLSLVESQRIAIAEMGILNSIIRRFSLFRLSSLTS